MLVKPGGTFDELLERRLRHGQSLAVEVVAQEVEALLDATDEGFLGCLSRLGPPRWRLACRRRRRGRTREPELRVSTIRAFGRLGPPHPNAVRHAAERSIL